MVSGQRGSLDEFSERACTAARAEQICFVKEALRLAAERLSKEQANVFWPTLGGVNQEECAVLCEITKGTARTRLHRARSFMRRACAVSNEAQDAGTYWTPCPQVLVPEQLAQLESASSSRVGR